MGYIKCIKVHPVFEANALRNKAKKKGRSEWKSSQATLIQPTEWHVWLGQEAHIFAHMQGNGQAYHALNMGLSYANKALRPT